VTVATLQLPVYDERDDAFAQLRGERVLIYWPHGFGDFVHLGYVLPLLERSNTYFVTRFGDDFVHLYDEASGVTPLLSGVRAIGDGAAQGARHLGIDWKRIRNAEASVRIPEPLVSRVRDAGITSLLYTDYPEYAGRRAYPFQTKARALIERLVDPLRIRAADVDRPLRNALAFDVPHDVRARVEARLRSWVERGDRLYLVAPGGHTNAAKDWPAHEVRGFEEGLRAHDARGHVLVVDEHSLAQRFCDLDVSFAHLFVTLLRSSHAFVGVGAGPLHAAIAMRNQPAVGIWLAHHPDWYDEPYDGALHLTGPRIASERLDRRAATRTTPLHYRARVIAFPDRVPRAADVFAALRLLC
jgi:hypothetical protein